MWGFVLLILLYFGAAAWLAFRLPPFIAPNEVLNYEYISVMRQIRGLPNRGLVDVEIRYNEWHQPPLYFLWAGLVSAAVPVEPAPNPPPPLDVAPNPFFRGTPRGNLNVYLPDVYQEMPLYMPTQVAAALWGMLCLAGLYRWTSRLFQPSVALLMVSLIAFQPNFLFFSTNINNDMPLTALSAVTLATAVWVVARQKGAWAWFGLGLLTALTILTKANGVFALAYLGTAGLLQLWQSRQFWATVRLGLAALAGLVPLWGAWLILNSIRMRDALGVSGSLPVRDVLLEGPRHLPLLIPLWEQIWWSFWLDWSVGEIAHGATWIYGLGLGMVVVGLGGWLRPRPWSFAPPRRLLWIPLLGGLCISLLYFAVKALSAYREGVIVPEGRWWLPVWPALVWLMVLGWQRWWPEKWRPTVNLATTAVPLLLAGYLLLVYIPYFYPRAQPIATLPLASEATAVGLQYGDLLELAAVQPTAVDVPLDEPTAVSLFWRVTSPTPLTQNFIIAAQLLTTPPTGWEVMAQHNSHPGLGGTVTSGWQPGELWRDEIILAPSAADLPLNGPTQAALAVWVGDGQKQLPITRAGQPTELPFVLPAVLRPHLAQPATTGWLSAPVHFGEIIALVAVEQQEEALVLWWQSLAATPHHYTVFVHLLDDAGNLVAQADGVPNKGLSPTAVWLPGELIRDVRPISPEGRVAIGLYDGATGVRLTAVDTATGEHLLNDAVQIIATE